MNHIAKGILQSFFILIGIALLLFFLWMVQTVLMYLLIAVVLSLIGNPLTNLLSKLRIGKVKLPRGVAAIVTLFVMVGVLGGLLSLIIPLVTEQARIISSTDVDQVVKNLEEPLQQVNEWSDQFNLSEGNKITDRAFWEAKLKGFISFTQVSDLLSSLIGTMGNIFVAIFSIGFITFFFLKEDKLAPNMLIAVTPDKNVEQVKNIMSNTRRLLSRYFIGVLIQVMAITIIVSTGLMIFGVDNALLIGFVAGIINVIPYVGPLIGMAFGVVIGISTNLHLDFYDGMIPLALKIISVFIVVQLLDNFVFQPFIFSNSVNAHPLEIFLVILSAGYLAGVPGMILAVPTYAIIRIVAKEFLFGFKIVKSLTKDI